MVFLTLTLGAFFWNPPGFILRAILWVSVTTLVLVLSVIGGRLPSEELIEIPLLTAILFMVFAITRERAKTEGRFCSLFEAAVEGIILHESGAIVDWNRAFEVLFGYPHSEVIGRTVVDFAAPESLELITQRFLSENEAPFEAIGLKKDGSTFPIEISSKIIPYQGRTVSVASIRDITERVQAEKMKDEIIYTVSHELRTPITSIKGYVDLLRDGQIGELEEGQLRALRIISRNTDRLATLVKDLLDLARIEAGLLEMNIGDVDICELVEGVIQEYSSFGEEKQIQTSLDIPRDPIIVSGDQYRLHEVLVNLIDNAYKYSPQGTAVAVQVSSQADIARVCVADQGIGISEGDLSQLFSKFFRAKSQLKHSGGTGLGLYIAKTLIELQDGQISVSSKLDEGSIFCITIPTRIA